MTDGGESNEGYIHSTTKLRKEENMTLIERWKNVSDADVLSEIRLLFENYPNAIQLFTTDENSEQIRYCVDYREDDTVEKYGKQAGICISENVALANIQQVMLEYAYMLIPFFWSDLPAIDLGIRLNNAIGVELDETGREFEFREAVLEFRKCNNRAGFCVSKVVPLRDRQ